MSINKKTEMNIEFSKIKEKWMELAITKGAKEKISETNIFLSELELRKNLKDTTDGRNMIEICGTPPISAVDEVPDIMSHATSGNPLTVYQLERVSLALTAVRRIKDYLCRGKAYNNSLA